jgi:hypothetical protein
MTHRSGSPVLAIDASDCFSTESLPRRRIAAVAVSAVSSVASPLPLAAADAHVEILRAEIGDRLPLGVQHAYIELEQRYAAAEALLPLRASGARRKEHRNHRGDPGRAMRDGPNAHQL